MTRSRAPLLAAALALAATAVFAAWDKDYEDGLKAAAAENWPVVVEKMTAALREKPRENPRERGYGTRFIAYHPYYYRGIAYFHLGRLEEAIADLGKATGQGEVKIGSADSILVRAENQLAQQNQPPTTTQVAQQPTTTQPPIQTQPPPPVVPSVDPALAPARTRGRDLIQDAKSRMAEARRARADSLGEFAQGQQLITDAESKALQADTAADWTAVGSSADKAILAFNLAITKNQMAQSQQPPTKAPVAAATNEVTTELRRQVRIAVEAYFSGDFDRSVQQFQTLTRRDDDNALLWAFLGASYYYNWYLNGQTDEGQKQAAITAFRRARSSNGNLKLDGRYFPRRVQNFYETVRSDAN